MINLRDSKTFDNTLLKEAINHSELWMFKISALVDKLSISSTNRNRVACSFLNLCIEHYQGIHLLVNEGVIGSALVIFRPQLESYVRGSWYHLCATDNEIEKFIKGVEPPHFGILVNKLENQDGFEQGALTRIKVEHWKMLNDYTHGGIIQVKSRLNYETIEPNYQPERISRTLTASANLSFLAGIGIARIAESDEATLKLREAYSTIYKKFNDHLLSTSMSGSAAR